MKLIQRIGYYLGGFSIGLIVLAFFLNGKKVSCDYGPEARVLKNINTKTIVFSDRVQQKILNNDVDTLSINHIIKKGNINFSKSNTRQEPCGVYLIEGNYNAKKITLTIQNCGSIATITNLALK